VNDPIRTAHRGRSRAARLTVGVATAAVAVVAMAAPVFAHVDAEATGVTADGATEIALSFEHGCGNEPTIEMRVRLPEGSSNAVAGEVPGFTAAVTDGQIAWTGGSVPDGDAATFPFTVKLAQADGTEVPLPTIQRCPTSQNDWIEVGGDDDGSEDSSPAPVIVVPVGGGGQAAGGVGTDTQPDAQPTDDTDATMVTQTDGAEAPTPVMATDAEEATDTSDIDNSAGGAGLIVLLIASGVIIGGAVLLYVRNRRPTPDA